MLFRRHNEQAAPTGADDDASATAGEAAPTVAGGATPTGASGGAPPAGTGASGIVEDDQYMREAFEWAHTGARARASITSVTYGGTLSGDEVVWRMGIRVHPSEGEPYDTELALASIAYMEDFPPWEVGDPCTVVYDPSDPMQVRFLPPGEQPTARWQVPDTCPNCGARVDQSTAAFADHPTCKFCNQPLPCQPAL
jgi:hypothetical protein